MAKYELSLTVENANLEVTPEGPVTLSVLELIGPRGETGPQGPQGPQGIQGSPGDSVNLQIFDGNIAVGQSVLTTDDVTFNSVTTTGDVTVGGTLTATVNGLFVGDVTVEAGDTLDVSAGTLTLADDQISGDKVESGTIDAITINTLTATTINVSGNVDGRDLSVDGLKLDGIEAGATADQTDAEIKTAYENNADTNAFTDADRSKLDGIEANATADQTDAEIKTAYENNANTNAFTDADHSKLDGIEANADVTDTDNVTAAGALMDSEVTNLVAVKALDQGVATTDDVTFDDLTLTGQLKGPATFTIDPAAHGDDTGTVVVAGNLQVDGTTTTINSTIVEIDDLNLKLAAEATTNAQANGAGITVGDGLANITYNSGTDRWVLDKELSADVVGTVSGDVTGNVTGNLTGNVTGTVSTLTNHDTGDLAEGTNKYYTDERVDDRVANLVVDGTGLTKTYDDEANTLTFNHSNSVAGDTVSEGGVARQLGYGDAFNIPSVTYDNQGHITGTTTTQITLPASDNTDTTYTDGDGLTLTGTDFDIDLTDTVIFTSTNTASRAVVRDANGDFAANIITTDEDAIINGVNIGTGTGTGTNNTRVGEDALSSLTTGSNNTALGYKSGESTTTQGLNTFVGTLAGLNATSTENTAVGYAALYSGSAQQSNNTAIGSKSLYHITLGGSNTAVGRSAGYTLTTGSYNTMIGRSAHSSSATVTNEITLGDDTDKSFRIPGSSFYINGGSQGTTGTKVGINTSSPAAQLHVNGDTQADGNLTVSGDLTVNGTTTTIDSTTVAVADSLFKLAKDNTADSLDAGWYGVYNDGTEKYAGIARDASDGGKFILYDGLEVEPTTTVDTSGTGFNKATLVADIEGDVTSTGTSTFAAVDINGGAIDGTTIGATVTSTIAGTTVSASNGFSGDLTGDVTGDLTGDVTGNITSIGTSTFSSIDVNGGAIDNATIGGATPAAITGTSITANTGFSGNLTGDVTGSVTVGATKTLDVSAGTLTLADDQISGDKIDGGTIDSVAITSVDINGGNIDGTVIGAATPAAISGTTGQFNTSLNVTGTVTADTFSFANWTVEEVDGSLYFATGDTNKMKLDASGNLQVVGSVESNATIS